MRLTLDPTIASPRTQRLLQVWGVLQHELLFLMWGLMDVVLVTPVAMSLMRWTRFWQPGYFMLLLFFIMMLAFNLTRFMSALNIAPERQQTIIAVVLFLNAVLLLRSLFHNPTSLFDLSWIRAFFLSVNERGNTLWIQDVLLFGLILLMWVRGLQLAIRNYTVNRIGLRLRLGGLIFAPFIVWLGINQLVWDVTPFLLLFFLAGLTAVALVRAEEIEKEQTGHSAALDPRWLTMVLLAALATTLMAGLIAMIVSGRSPVDILGWLAPIIIAAELLTSVALATLLFLAIPLLEVGDRLILALSNLLNSLWLWLVSLTDIIAKIASKWKRYDRLPGQLPENAPPSGPIDTSLIFENLSDVGFRISRNAQIILLLLALAAILIVALIISRLYRQKTAAARFRDPTIANELEEEAEGNLAQRLLRRLGFLRDWRTAVSIRRIYRNMCRAAAASGYPRLEAETPYEYLHTLSRAWPNNQDDTRLITQAYVKIRYGELPETKAELNAIFTAWKRLERPQENLEEESA